MVGGGVQMFFLLGVQVFFFLLFAKGRFGLGTIFGG
jgi:hypothetical protein